MEYQPPEAPAPVSSPAVIPWEEPGPPWPQRLIATIQLLFMRPREAFERMPLDSELLKPFLFALIVGSVGWVAHLFWDTLTRGAMRGLMPGNMQFAGALAWNPLATLALAAGLAAAALAPAWVALEGPLPVLAPVLPARARAALVAMIALDWAYLVTRGV